MGTSRCWITIWFGVQIITFFLFWKNSTQEKKLNLFKSLMIEYFIFPFYFINNESINNIHVYKLAISVRSHCNRVGKPFKIALGPSPFWGHRVMTSTLKQGCQIKFLLKSNNTYKNPNKHENTFISFTKHLFFVYNNFFFFNSKI